MPCCYSSSLESRIRSWLRDYDRIQAVAVLLLYIQIGCALIGSLGALFNGVLLVNLVVALFALIAIESSSQSLGRMYAALLFCTMLLDAGWLILFSRTIWNFASKEYGTFFVLSLRIALSMQIIGFSVRFLSTFLWIQMYTLGPSSVDSSAFREADFDVRSSFLNPATHEIARQNSNSDAFIGGAIYDPVYYSSLFEDGPETGFIHEGGKRNVGYDKGSASSSGSPQLKSCVSKSFQIIDLVCNTYVGRGKKEKLTSKRGRGGVYQSAPRDHDGAPTEPNVPAPSEPNVPAPTEPNVPAPSEPNESVPIQPLWT